MAKSLKKSFRGKVKRTAEKREASKSGFSYLKLPSGVAQYKPTPGKIEKINILPYIVKSANHPDLDKAQGMAVKGEPWFQLPFKVHSNIGAGDESKTVVCPSTFGERCPICEYAAKRAKAGAEWEELKEYRPKERVLYAIEEVDTKSKNDTEFSVMDMSYHLFQKYLDEEIAEDENNECYADMEGGKTLKIRWSEQKFGKNSYAECGRIDFLDRDDIDDAKLEEVPCLDTILKVMSYEDLEKLFLQGEVENEADEDEDEEEEEKPKKKKSTKVVTEEEEEKPFDMDEDEEEDEEEKPKKKKSIKPAKKEEPEEVEKQEVYLTWEDLQDMNEDELLEAADTYTIAIDEEEEDLDVIRKAIAEDLGIDIPKPKKSVKPAKKEAPAKKKASPKAGECQGGGEFGKDFEQLDACAECPLWDACADKYDEL